MPTYDDLRRLYAAFITAKGGVADPRIEQAFHSVAREDFLGPGPWKIFVGEGYIDTPSADPALLYQDVLVAIIAERKLNNGAPGLHAICLSTVSPQPGEAVLQVGTGAGYYTAILAGLVGPAGRVLAYEIDEGLADLAQANLRAWPNVELRARSGTEGPLPESDVIYVSAGATRPVAAWLDALRPGGRLIFPLTPDDGWGGMLQVRRQAAGFSAAFVSPVQFIPCIGARDAETATGLAVAFAAGGAGSVRSLHVGSDEPDESCWFAAPGWWLSTRSLH